MRSQLLLILISGSLSINAQELFTFTEPASNMAAKSAGIRLNNFIMKDDFDSKTDVHIIPELMIGISKNLMIHGDVFFSNREGNLTAEGGSIYAKYRFFSDDDVQKHFRMALFGRYSFNKSHIHQESISLYGFNSGFETGLIATQLLHKVALSSSVSILKATDNGSDNKFPYGSSHNKAINYTLSIGKLMLPKTYTSYKQTNLNLMFELLNQYNPGSGKYYIDAAPSVQFIFNSVARVDAGYRKELRSTLFRTAPNGFFLRLEYNLFNVY